MPIKLTPRTSFRLMPRIANNHSSYPPKLTEHMFNYIIKHTPAFGRIRNQIE